MKRIYLLSFLFLASMTAFSESPKKAVGIRGGLTPGFEYRVFSGELTSYKALFSFRNQGLQFTGLKEFHVPDAFDIGEEAFTFVYGFGAHAGFESWDEDVYHYENGQEYNYQDRRTSPIVGLDGLAAIEYTIPAVPLVAGFEVKPYFNLFGENFFRIQPFDFAFTLKYTF
jgi:hypothetical protein